MSAANWGIFLFRGGGGVPACSVPLHNAQGCISAAFGDAQVDLALAARH